MLDWHSCQICYPLEIKILLLYYYYFSGFVVKTVESHFAWFCSLVQICLAEKKRNDAFQ